MLAKREWNFEIFKFLNAPFEQGDRLNLEIQSTKFEP